jgi:molybdopterin-containing oxidoreductase family membrane subunit
LLFIRVLPSVAMAEVRLLVKTASEQSKKKLIDEGKVKQEEADYYIESLGAYDSVEQADYVKI